jgi:hypothetical protein
VYLIDIIVEGKAYANAVMLVEWIKYYSRLGNEITSLNISPFGLPLVDRASRTVI